MSSPVRLHRTRNLTLDAPKSKSRVTFKEEAILSQMHHAAAASNTSVSPNIPFPRLSRKLRYESEFKTRRKRAHSCSFSWDHQQQQQQQQLSSSKRRKPSGSIVLPTKFLLGGNITDPLNLEALDKGDANKPSDEPISGPCRRGGTVRVIIPPNINDPLNLDACSEDGEEQLADAISRQRRRRKSRKRKRRNSEPGGTTCEPEMGKRLCTSLDDSNTARILSLQSALAQSRFRDKKEKSTSASAVASASAEVASVSVAPSATSSVSLSSTVPGSSAVSTVAVTTTSSSVCASRSVGGTGGTCEPMTLPPKASTSGSSISSSTSSSTTPSTPHPPSRHQQQKKQRSKPENKIVSPVIPQPVEKRKYSKQSSTSSDKSTTTQNQPKSSLNSKNSFQYGNYNQYYGYRNLGHKIDPRLKFLKKEWFCGKEVLDIGCNIGHMTFSIGRDFGPRTITGIDIDKKLVNIAKKNVKHYLKDVQKVEDEFPSSMKLLYGPLKPPVDKEGQKKFPHNIRFCQSNYVLENDALLETVRPEFDVVLCLSVTKWIHLNWGDEGLKRFFRRVFRNLKAGGVLVLEPQAWPSYTKKKKLTPEIFENYKKINLFPNKFGEFLTSEVGFAFVKKGSVYQHCSRGFDRPIYIYKKPCPEKLSPRDTGSRTQPEELKSIKKKTLLTTSPIDTSICTSSSQQADVSGVLVQSSSQEVGEEDSGQVETTAGKEGTPTSSQSVSESETVFNETMNLITESELTDSCAVSDSSLRTSPAVELSKLPSDTSDKSDTVIVAGESEDSSANSSSVVVLKPGSQSTVKSKTEGGNSTSTKLVSELTESTSTSPKAMTSSSPQLPSVVNILVTTPDAHALTTSALVYATSVSVSKENEKLITETTSLSDLTSTSETTGTKLTSETSESKPTSTSESTENKETLTSETTGTKATLTSDATSSSEIKTSEIKTTTSSSPSSVQSETETRVSKSEHLDPESKRGTLESRKE